MRTHKPTEISSLLIRGRHTQDVPVTFLPTVSLVAIASLSCILCSSLGHSLYVVVRAKNGLVRQLRRCVGDSPILHRLLQSSWSTKIHRTGAPSAQCGMVANKYTGANNSPCTDKRDRCSEQMEMASDTRPSFFQRQTTA